MENTLVSVILPVYNCEKYIKECIDSILCQTYTNFEVWIIDDCSTDNTIEIIKNYKDERIILKLKENNTGITDSLIWGIENAKGDFIARVDGDDVCMSNRFEEQIKIMNKYPEISVCGSWAKIIGSDQVLKTSEFHEDIFKEMFLKCPMIHPTIMFRKNFFKFYNYDNKFEFAEDYSLWSSAIFKMKFYNIQSCLLAYRIHDNNVSKTRQEVQVLNFHKSLFEIHSRLFKIENQVHYDDFINFYNFNHFTKSTFIKLYNNYNDQTDIKEIKSKLIVVMIRKFMTHKILYNSNFSFYISVFPYLSFLDKLRVIKWCIRKLLKDF